MTKTKLQTLDIDYDVANGCVVITELNGADPHKIRDHY